MYDVCDVPPSMRTIYLGEKTSSIPGMHHAQKAPVASRRKAVLGREVLKQRPRSGQGEAAKGYRAVAKNGVYSN